MALRTGLTTGMPLSRIGGSGLSCSGELVGRTRCTASLPTDKNSRFRGVTDHRVLPLSQTYGNFAACQIERCGGNAQLSRLKTPSRVPPATRQRLLTVPRQPLQARRTDGSRRQACLQQGQGAGAEAAEGHGEVAARVDHHRRRPVRQHVLRHVRAWGEPDRPLRPSVTRTIQNTRALVGRTHWR